MQGECARVAWIMCKGCRRAPEVWDRWDRRSRTKSRLVGQIMWDKKDLIGHYCQYKGHLTHIKETHKDCHMNLGQYFQ